MAFPRLACCLLVVAGSACSSPDPAANDGTGAAGVPPCVLEVLEAKCARCHGSPPTHGAPVTLLSAEDFQAPYAQGQSEWWEIAADRVEQDVMPYVALNDGPSPIVPPVEPLTSAEKATLLGWLQRGARSNDAGACSP